MKNALLILFIAGFFITCKKDKSPSAAKETVLSKVYFNNVLVEEFVYSSEKQLERINEYSEVNGKFTNASGFEYNAEGKMTTENQYSSTNKLSGQVIYTWLPGGGLSYHQYKSLSGPDSGKLINRVNYSYDGAGRIGQQAWINLTSNLVETTSDYTYYNNNNLRSSSVYNYSGGPLLKWKTEYADANPIPPSLLKHQGYPINFILFDMLAGESHFYMYSNGAVSYESKEVFSNRKYDNAGFLLQQTITRQNIKPVSPDVVIDAKYEYIQL